MSLLSDLVTVIIDPIFDSAAAKLYKSRPFLALALSLVGFVASIIAIVVFYRYFA